MPGLFCYTTNYLDTSSFPAKDTEDTPRKKITPFMFMQLLPTSNPTMEIVWWYVFGRGREDTEFSQTCSFT